MRCFFVMAFAVLMCSCDKKEKITTIDYHFMPFYFGKIYLEKIPVNEEDLQVIDSAEITYKTDHLSFEIPELEQSVFRLRMGGKPLRIYFINDQDHIVINGSSSDPKDYSFKAGGYNQYLKAFIDEQGKLIAEITALTEKVRRISTDEQAIYTQQADSLKAIYESNARSFADTTQSPGAFLFAYNGIDFGNDRNAFRQFITRAAKRFPGHKNIQVLKQETLDYISIYEEELNVGDQMPQLFLPDIHGNELPVLHSGKYQLIDLWSTWCAPCIKFISSKKEAAGIFNHRLSMVNVAVDAEKEVLQQMIMQQQIPGTHFIDEKMWRGKAAKAWKFDSIPFNFLIAPDGKILAKAIPPDSLLQVLNKFVK